MYCVTTLLAFRYSCVESLLQLCYVIVTVLALSESFVAIIY